MAELYAWIEIDAPVERVWRVLSDWEDYPRWNPFLRYVTGAPAVGAVLAVHLSLQDGRIRTIAAQMLAFQPGREMRWRGRLETSRFFDVEHALLIEPVGEGSVRFTQRLVLHGMQAPFLMGLVQKKVQRGLVEMNQALKDEFGSSLPPETWFRKEQVGNAS
jgi:hypothetical protein